MALMTRNGTKYAIIVINLPAMASGSRVTMMAMS